MTRKIYLVTFFSYIFTIFLLFFYSFTQVDLNLTISKNPILLNIQKQFTFIGYYERPLSSLLFLIILSLLFIFYLIIIKLVKNNQLSKKRFWKLLLAVALILIFSYPAFSYDVFNYMFDAKTISFYHANPWVVKPLDFPHDPWIRFMHWVHRPSIYPPIWISLSLLPFIFGFGKFILILINFKIFIALFYFASIILLEKILILKKERNVLLKLSYFAFNPLVIIECLVSSHNDIVMIFFALASLYLCLNRQKVWSILSMVSSTLIKYATVALIPLEAFYLLKKNRLSSNTFLTISFFIQTLTFFIIIFLMEVQPWYFLWVLPFVLLTDLNYLLPIVVGLSFGLLLRYLPFLYLGNWNFPADIWKIWLTIIPVIFSAILSLRLSWLAIRKKDGTIQNEQTKR